jgi:hypothetical protein
MLQEKQESKTQRSSAQRNEVEWQNNEENIE